MAEVDSAVIARDREKLCSELIAPSQLPTGQAQSRCIKKLPITGEPSEHGAVTSVSIEETTAQVTFENGGFADLLNEDGTWYLDIQR